LNETLAGHNALCSAQITALNEQIEDLTSEVDVIRQVIEIFEGQAIQDVRSVVDDF